MNPLDAQAQDRRRYFHGGWMLYRGRTKVQVSVSEAGRFSMRRTRGGPTESVAARFLRAYYPEGACINIEGTGIHVERRARQTARRTASTQHYTVTFSPPQRPWILDDRVMWALVSPTPYPTWRRAMTMLEEGRALSVAVSPDLIVWNTGNGHPYVVLWHDSQVGVLQNGVFVPNADETCWTKVARQALQEINAPCL